MRRFGFLSVLFCLLAGQILFAAPAKNASAKPTAVQLSTRDGWSLSAVYQAPTTEQRTVILLHDLNKDKNAFATLEQDLSSAGFGFLALDFRGHGKSQNLGDVKSFRREGVDNPFNQMVKDVQAAVEFLEKKGISVEKMALVGAGLGAQVAAKSAVLTGVPMLGLISPVTNVRDVLVIPSMRVYKGDVLIAAAAADKRNFLEASVIRNVAFLTSGEGKVTFLTAYDLTSHEMLDKYLRPSLIQWLKTPHKPDVNPDAPALEATDLSGVPVAPSATEQALKPSLGVF